MITIAVTEIEENESQSHSTAEQCWYSEEGEKERGMQRKVAKFNKA